jgi:glyoxylase-like metal-dependent hydrolase (beta-lactamase superfamily II)
VTSSRSLRLQVGNVEVWSLPDGYADLAGHGATAEPGEPPIDWAPIVSRNPNAVHDAEHHWRIHNNNYLVRSQDRTILVDLGVGVGPYPRYRNMYGRLPEAMQNAGRAFEEVDTVFFTHSHPDHVAWSMVEEEDRPRFTNARYLLHEKDWAEFTGRDPVPRYIDRFVRPLHTLGVLDLLPGETRLTDEVTAIEAPGHTPGHMAVIIASAGECAVISGDVFNHPLFVTEPWRTFGADLDHAQGIETRNALLDRIEADGMRLIAEHFPEPGWGNVVRAEGKRWFQAL